MGERKKSWREIDKLRDRSRHTRSSSEPKSMLEQALDDPRLKKLYLKEAEKLFLGPKGTPEHDEALKRLKDSYGKKSFEQAARDYVSKFGLPDEWGVLILLLDLKDSPQIVCDAMEKAKDMLDTKGPLEKTGFVSKLKVLSMTSPDPDISEVAEEILEAIS